MGIKHVYMMPGSTMGAAMIISVHSDGSVDALDSTRVGEKFASAYRGKFRTVAEAAGHDPLIMEAMVDPDVVLSIARDLDGKPVILKGTPAENTASSDQYSVAPRLLSERGKLLTLSAGEAVDVGVAGALVNNYDELAKQMNLAGWADAGDAGRKIVDDHDKEIRDNISKYDKSIKTINEGISRIRRLGGHELAGFEQNVIAIRNAIVRVEKMAEKHNYIAHRLAMDFPEGTEDLKAQCDNALGNIKDYRRQMRAR